MELLELVGLLLNPEVVAAILIVALIGYIANEIENGPVSSVQEVSQPTGESNESVEPGPGPAPQPRPMPDIPPLEPDEPKDEYIQQAIVRQFENTSGDVGHFTIEVINNKNILTTHLEPYAEGKLTFVTSPDFVYSNEIDNELLVHTAVINLADAKSAQELQEKLLVAGDQGPYDPLKNSCLSHVVDILNEGRTNKINKSEQGYARFLLQYGFKRLNH